MKKLLTTILILAAFSAHLSAQVYFEDEDDTVVTPPPQVYFGGNFSMNFGGLGGGQDGFLELSPLVGFMLTKKFSVGVGGTYLYTSKEYLVLPSNNRVRFDFSTYGARGFLRQNITERAFLQTEYESLNVEVPLNDGSGNTGREWVPGVFIGGGTFLPISTRLGMNISFFTIWLMIICVLPIRIRSSYEEAYLFGKLEYYPKLCTQFLQIDLYWF